ncbi:unnamed protein product, partial [Didymodactylos carnosus]
KESREARAAFEAVQYPIEQEYERQRILQNEQTEREKREANEVWQDSLKQKEEHENFQREFFRKPVRESFQSTTVEYGNIDKHSIIKTGKKLRTIAAIILRILIKALIK